MKHNNIFSPAPPDVSGPEFFEILLDSPDVRIERIVGLKPFIKPGQWYDQDEDEWLVLLQGDAELEIKNKKTLHLKRGDYYFLPAHTIHRVSRTTAEPRCIWLTVFRKIK